jgi:hypothetical protein
VRAAAESRRNTWLNITSPMSQSNYLRLCSEDPAICSGREEFFEKLRTDKEFSLAFQNSLGDLLPDNFESMAVGVKGRSQYS